MLWLSSSKNISSMQTCLWFLAIRTYRAIKMFGQLIFKFLLTLHLSIMRSFGI
ncbi:hypothetical protein HanIR_Chr06g0279091 [Helianthus annuus]|nr:hypothetical protein HanIR_Chr06g0279091 [Helianthus annuus]